MINFPPVYTINTVQRKNVRLCSFKFFSKHVYNIIFYDSFFKSVIFFLYNYKFSFLVYDS